MKALDNEKEQFSFAGRRRGTCRSAVSPLRARGPIHTGRDVRPVDRHQEGEGLQRRQGVRKVVQKVRCSCVEILFFRWLLLYNL
jgi:hypothetical protein